MILLVILLHEIRKYMTLKVIDHNYRYPERNAESLGERSPDQERTEKARPSGKCNRREFLRLHARLLQRLADNRNNVLLVRPGCKFRHDPAVILVNLLAGNDIGQKISVPYNSCGSVIAR